MHEMDKNNDTHVTVLTILNNGSENTLDSSYKKHLNVVGFSPEQNMNQEDTHESSRQSAIWTKNATLMLLNLYETKLRTLDNPKKKTKMWISMAVELKSYNIEVTPDQVRWKINALTKRYRDCLENGNVIGFKYYNEMHDILGNYNEDLDTYRLSSGDQNQMNLETNLNASYRKTVSRTPLKKIKSERRVKHELEKQILDYIRKQEIQNQIRDERFERSLRLREEEVSLKKKELEIKHSIALKKIQLREKYNEEILKIEKEKCNLLRKLLGHNLS